MAKKSGIKEYRKLARQLAKLAGIRGKVRVYELTNREDPFFTAYGIYYLKPKRTIAIRLRNPFTWRPYSPRFILATIAHELAHCFGWRHTQKYRRHQRRLSKLLRSLT
jgi:hypothetical protein